MHIQIGEKLYFSIINEITKVKHIQFFNYDFSQLQIVFAVN